MPESQGHSYGRLESAKFNHRREAFYNYLEFLKGQNTSIDDLVLHPTTYMGHMTLNRLLSLNTLYQKTLGLAGHIADVGVYKGGSSLLFAKLIKIHESEALTLCHGFDWFQGQLNTEHDSKLTHDRGYSSDNSYLEEIVQLQQLENILKLHNLDLRHDVNQFFEEHNHLRFKLVNMDCGKYEVVKGCLMHFWERLNTGGVMIFDQYSHEHAPGETKAVHEILGDISIKKLPNSWTPTAYVIK